MEVSAAALGAQRGHLWLRLRAGGGKQGWGLKARDRRDEEGVEGKRRAASRILPGFLGGNLQSIGKTREKTICRKM